MKKDDIAAKSGGDGFSNRRAPCRIGLHTPASAPSADAISECASEAEIHSEINGFESPHHFKDN